MSRLVSAHLAALCALGAGSTVAQESSEESAAPLEEITVTARRRSESLQEVPIAIDTLDQERIRQFNIQTTEDAARYIPSLTFDVGVLPQDTRPSIRGVTAVRGRPNVGMLIDHIDVSSEALTVAGGGITANLRLLDLERIEVVKGPQAALYGRSAFTGAVNYVTRRPSREFEGTIKADYNEHNAWELGLSLSGPLGDTVAGRLSAVTYSSDGWYENPNTGGKLAEGDSSGISGAIEWQPNDQFSWYVRAEYTDESFSPRAEVLLRAIVPEFNPQVNFLGTGTVTDAAVQYPYEFTQTTCNGIDRQQPYWDSFFMGPMCRPIISGEVGADESDIDISPDPRTGRDFRGYEVENARIYSDIVWEGDELTFQYLFGYTDNYMEVEQDFDLTNHQIYSVPFAFSQFGRTN